MRRIPESHITETIFRALQYISAYHSPDFIQSMTRAWKKEESPAAKNAIGQILKNSKMAAIGFRPICQDTGIVVVFVEIGTKVWIDTELSLQDLINEGVRKAYTSPENPLRASVVKNPESDRINTKDNTPAVIHMESIPGDEIHFWVAAKGGGSENKAKFAVLNPSDSIVDWVLQKIPEMGAGWCPPGVLGIGIGGTPEKAMLLAKRSLLDPIDIDKLNDSDPVQKLRKEIYTKANSLGIGAQGLGGLTTVLDVKIRTYPTHAASLPIALIPNCAATRHIHFSLNGETIPDFIPPPIQTWPDMEEDSRTESKIVDLDSLTSDSILDWKAGDRLLLRGTLLTGRDAAHKKIVELLREGKSLPVDLKGKFLYYVGPVDKKPGSDEVVGPAGPTTSTRMDKFTEEILETGILGMIGKAERGNQTVELLKNKKRAYLIAVGGAAYLVSKAIRSSEVIAFPELGMEAIHKFEVFDMPVLVAVDTSGNSIHKTGPAYWKQKIEIANATEKG
ncbi:fumarate hydratase [Leptospira selangorensis]|uniref:Fumarate hydratase class I n=1 Tax=Leptospira selangorensis TaxID=2484982 RepID=A0A5F2C525_9LEPT|nr:fumarate hydratase [Leptospira selangorensis]TGM10804.1 fumarate hydratase [Leptospira selangorensis]TGM26839.1 fumarate hydratase [Leptospira selangorensis]